jgi:hypothetical protein
VRQSLVVPTDAMSIRVGVHDRTNDRTGTLETALPIAPGSRESESRTRAPTLVRRGMIFPGVTIYGRSIHGVSIPDQHCRLTVLILAYTPTPTWLTAPILRPRGLNSPATWG